MWQTFRRLDLNGNGYIDSVEFKDGLKDLGFNLTSTEANDIMQYFDFHADGRVSYEEFVAFLEGEDATIANSKPSKKRSSSDGKGHWTSDAQSTPCIPTAVGRRKRRP